MSLPKHTSSPLSSSPSRHSLRRPESNPPSRPQSIDRPPTVQPARPVVQEHHSYEHAGDVPTAIPEDDSHAEASATQRPLLQPFFTLIEDATTSEYYHPTVHYIFSDDDTDIVTEAALRSLEADQDSFPGNGKGTSRTTRELQPSQTGEEGDAAYDDDELASPRKESQLPPPIPGVRNNYIILDMDPIPTADSHPPHLAPNRDTEDSVSSAAIPQPQPATDRQHRLPHQFRVTSAHSLTPAWQVLNTQLVPAPTFENNASGEQSVNGGLMLKIHGTPGLPTASSGKDRDKERGSQRLEDMMEQFSKRLGELRQVMEAGEPVGVSNERAETEGLQDDPEDNPAGRAESQNRAQGDIENPVQGSYVDESCPAR